MSINADGISSLFNEESPLEDEISYMIIFYCTEEFYSKYSKFSNKDNLSDAQSLDPNNETATKILKSEILDPSPRENNETPPQIKKNDLNYFFDVFMDNEIKESRKFKQLLKQSFENLDKYEDSLLELLITLQCKKNSLTQEDELGGEFLYEDFILILLRLIKFYTKLNIKLEIPQGEKKIYIKFFGTETTFDRLANHLGYDLQLKPYALKYNYLYSKGGALGHSSFILNQQDTDLINETRRDMTNSNIPQNQNDSHENLEDEERHLIFEEYKNLQFYELDENNALHWPPYSEFEMSKNVKFRRYEKDDCYHECLEDPEFMLKHGEEARNQRLADTTHAEYNNLRRYGSILINPHDLQQMNTNNLLSKNIHEFTVHQSDCCSKFRNIDKLRLIQRTLESMIKFQFLHKKNIFEIVSIKRNYLFYGKNENSSIPNLLSSTLNIYSDKEQKKLINLIRNFYGEKISFYFLWMIFYNNWLIFPALLGLVTGIISYTADDALKQAGHVTTFKNLTFNYFDVTLFCFCLLITIWATVFLNAWKQKEKLYKYFWGMENQDSNEPNQETFSPDEKIPFLFGQKLPISYSYKRYLKTFVSYFVIILLVSINILLVYLLFRWKAYKTNNGRTSTLFFNILVASINGLQIKLMSLLDEYIADKLTNWENYEKNSQRENSLAIKLIIFEFFNKYFSLYYIAFFKPYLLEYCIDNNCFKEIEIQLYVILLIKFLFNSLDILYPYLVFKWRKRKYFEKKNMPVGEIEPHSHEHQIISEDMNTLIFEYNDIIILFGYVVFFSVAAPMTPIIIFVITYVEKIEDCYKFFYLSRISFIDGASGIAIYNKILKIFYFLGMITNIAIVLYTSPGLIDVQAYQEENILNNTDFIVKFLILALFENVVLLMMSYMNFDFLPKCKLKKIIFILNKYLYN
jgi:hypothetical protein